MNTKKYLLTIAAFSLIVTLGAGCNPFAKDKPEETDPVVAVEDRVADDTDYGDPQMAEDTALSNPATVYCLSRDGEFTMEKTLAGTTEGYCKLDDGTECEVWAMYKGECGDLEEPEEEEEDETTTSTDDGTELDDDLDTSTSTAMEEEEEEEDVSAVDPDEKDTEKKKLTGDIDIAVKPGEENGEIIMSWDTHDLNAPNGYIVMLSGSDNISYPNKYYHELEREESYSFTWIDLNVDKEYYFRVCIKKGDGCGTYSPTISTYPKSEDIE
jgi:putative hemolysin